MPGPVPEDADRFIYVGTGLSMPDPERNGPGGRNTVEPGADLVEVLGGRDDAEELVERCWLGLHDVVALFDEDGSLIRSAGAGKENPERAAEVLELGEQPIRLG